MINIRIDRKSLGMVTEWISNQIQSINILQIQGN